MRISKGAAKRAAKSSVITPGPRTAKASISYIVRREPRNDTIKSLNRMADRIGTDRWDGITKEVW